MLHCLLPISHPPYWEKRFSYVPKFSPHRFGCLWDCSVVSGGESFLRETYLISLIYSSYRKNVFLSINSVSNFQNRDLCTFNKISFCNRLLFVQAHFISHMLRCNFIEGVQILRFVVLTQDNTFCYCVWKQQESRDILTK